MIFHTTDWHLDHDNIIRFDKRPDADVSSMNARILETTNQYVGEKDWLVYHGDLVMNKKIDHAAYIERVKLFLDQLRCKNIIFVGGNHDRIWQGLYRPNWVLWNMFRIWECEACGITFDEQRRFSLPKTCKKGCDAPTNPIYNLHPMGYELRITKRICAEQQIPIEYDGMLVVCTHYSHRVWNKSHHAGKKEEVGKSINLYGHSHGGLPGIKNSFDVGFNIWNRPLSLLEILTKLMPEHNQSKEGQMYFGHHNDERE